MPTEKLAVQYSKRLGLVMTLAIIGLIVLFALRFASASSLFRDQVIELNREDTRIRVHSQLLSAKSGDFPEKLLLVVKGVSIHEDLAEEVFGIACVDRIVANYYTTGIIELGDQEVVHIEGDREVLHIEGYQEVLRTDSTPSKTICVEYGDPDTEYSYEYFPLDWTIELRTDPLKYEYYKYPYDHITVGATFDFKVRLHDFSDNSVQSFELPASHIIEIWLPGWRAYEVTGPDRVSPPELRLRRSPLVRVLAPVLIALLFLVTALLPSLDSLDSAVEIAVALVLGVWGVRQTLLPGDAPGFTGLDMILLGEYGVLTLAVLGSVVRHLIATRTTVKQPTQSLSDSYRYVGLIQSNVYHMVGCRHVADRSTSQLAKYQDRDQAEAAGKRPCHTCMAGDSAKDG